MLSFSLGINLYPNPVSGFSTLSYTSSQNSFVTLKIYDVNGRLVQEPLQELQQAGKQEILIDGKMQSGDTTGLKKLVKH